MPSAKQILMRKIAEARAQNVNHFGTLQRQIDLILQYIQHHT